MMKYSTKILILLILLLLVSLACQIAIGGPTPSRTVPVSTEAAGSLEDSWKTVMDSPDVNSPIAITLTEEQLTSFLAIQLSQQTDPLLTNPQVLLQNGQVEIFGQAQRGSIQANVRITLQVSANETGDLKISLASVDMGPIPAPQSLLDQISTTLDETMKSSIGSTAAGIKIESIYISDGLLTISGQKR